MTRYDGTSGTAPRGSAWTSNYLFANAAAALTRLKRTPNTSACRFDPAVVRRRMALYAALAALAIAAAMLWLDAPAIAAVRRLPPWIVWLFAEITQFGLSGWFLIPLGVLLVAAALVDGPWLQHWSRLVLATLVVRLGFLFAAIAVPGLANNILKRLIGRARPSDLGPYVYEPVAWRAAFQSMPSGHATTAFSVLVAFGAVFPRLRWLLWCYAFVIAASRVVVQAHYPSDVLAGAALGAGLALVVRDWFARRRLGLWIAPGGKIHPWPAPSMARIKGVARRLFAP